MRTHHVAGNGGSSGSDVDMVACLRLARVGRLFQIMLLIVWRFKKKEAYNASELPKQLEFPDYKWSNESSQKRMIRWFWPISIKVQC